VHSLIANPSSQPPVDAGETQNSVAVHPSSFPNPSGASPKAAQSRVGRHEAVTRPSDDFASRAFREAQLESKTGPVVTLPLAHRPDHPLASQSAPPTQTRRDNGADTALDVPGDRSAKSHSPHVSAALPHDYVNSKRPSTEKPSGPSSRLTFALTNVVVSTTPAIAGFKPSSSQPGDPWNGGDSEASYAHGQVLPHTQAENKGHIATTATSPWNHSQSYHAVPSSSQVDPTRKSAGPVKQSHLSRQGGTPVKETVITMLTSQPSPMGISHPLVNTAQQPAHAITQSPAPKHVGGPSESRLPEPRSVGQPNLPFAITGGPRRRQQDEPPNVKFGPATRGSPRIPDCSSPGLHRDQPAPFGLILPPGQGPGGTPRTPGNSGPPVYPPAVQPVQKPGGGGCCCCGGGGGGGCFCF